MPLDWEWSAAELDALQDEVPYRVEVVDGVLVVNPRAYPWHNHVGGEVCDVLAAAAPSGAWAYFGVEIRHVEGEMVHRSLVPDVMVAPRRLCDERADYAVPGDVSLVVEVVSTHSEVFDRRVRPVLYADFGIPSMWLIDRTLTLVEYRLAPDGDPEIVRTVRGGTFTTDIPFPITLNLDALG
ncbi:Uma2 family endonuclease [Cryptosporangium sp. NPDC048952]|uniref:Uma2 family endonuclease n=1 Tax=Cryptosporangium sp. NPDC048952 TaxID=3363961 RepID=UPI003724362F